MGEDALVAGRGDDLFARPRQLVRAAPVDVDGHPHRRQPLGQRATEAVGRPGDQRDGVFRRAAHGTRRTILPAPWPVFRVPVRVGRPLQVEDLVDLDLQLALLDQVAQPGQADRVGLDQDPGRPLVLGGGDLVQLRLHPARHRDQRRARAHRRQRALPVATGEVDHRVEFRQLRVEVVVAVVERPRRSQPGEEVGLLAPRGGEDVGAARRGDLHGEVADPARAAVDQHVVALLHADRVDDDLPGGQPGQRQRPRLLDRERVRLALEVARGRGDELGVGARFAREPGHAEDLVADLEAGHATAHLGHLAADVPADRDREVPHARRRSPSHARLEVDRVDPGGADPHLDLGRDRLRSVDLLEPQHLRPTELMLDDRLHEADIRTPLRSQA